MVVTMNARLDDRAGLARYLDPSSSPPPAAPVAKPRHQQQHRPGEAPKHNTKQCGLARRPATDRSAARQFLKNPLVRQLTFDLADAIRRCGEIGTSGVAVGENNVRVNVCFRLDVSPATWDGLTRASDSQSRSRSAVIQRLSRFIVRAGTVEALHAWADKTST